MSADPWSPRVIALMLKLERQRVIALIDDEIDGWLLACEPDDDIPASAIVDSLLMLQQRIKDERNDNAGSR